MQEANQIEHALARQIGAGAGDHGVPFGAVGTVKREAGQVDDIVHGGLLFDRRMAGLALWRNKRNYGGA